MISLIKYIDHRVADALGEVRERCIKQGIATQLSPKEFLSVHCEKVEGCATQITVAMSDRGRVWLLSSTGSHPPQEIATDNLLHGLTVDEQQVSVTLPQGLSVLLVKSLNEFAADTIAVNGSRAPGWGVVGPTVGLGMLNGTNEWGVALSLKYDQ